MSTSISGARRFRNVVLPILLIVLGTLLLLQNFGALPWSIWQVLWRFWPVILVLVGLELILSRTSPLLTAAIALVAVLGVIGAAVFLVTPGYGTTLPLAAPAPTQTEHLAQPLDNHERSRVEIQFGAGELYLNGLASDNPNLMEGDFAHGDARSVSRSYDCRNDDCVLRLVSQGGNSFAFASAGPETWRVGLTPRIPVDLRVQAGASRVDLDLQALQLSGLRLELGASSGHVKMPRAVATTAVIRTGAAALDVEIPQDTATRIYARTGLGTLNVDEQRFPRDGEYFASPDFAIATNRLDLQIDAGAATVTIR